MPRTCNPLGEEQFLQGSMVCNEISPQWIELAESLKFLSESRAKIGSLEKEIDNLIADSDERSTIDQKIQEYRNLIHVYSTYNRDLLEKHGQKLFMKAENSNFQEVLTLNRVDEALQKVFTLKLKAKTVPNY